MASVTLCDEWWAEHSFIVLLNRLLIDRLGGFAQPQHGENIPIEKKRVRIAATSTPTQNIAHLWRLQ